MTRHEDDFTRQDLDARIDDQLVLLESLVAQHEPLKSCHLTLSHPPSGLSREEAARHVGVSTSSFDDLVARGIMPKPLELGIRRNVWNVRALDAALDHLAGLNREGVPDPMTNSLLRRLHEQG